MEDTETVALRLHTGDSASDSTALWASPLQRAAEEHAMNHMVPGEGTAMPGKECKKGMRPLPFTPPCKLQHQCPRPPKPTQAC
jgi:hypothetical protein